MLSLTKITITLLRFIKPVAQGLLYIVGLIGILFSLPASAADGPNTGPGIGNTAHPNTGVISQIDSLHGHGQVAMLNGYLVVITAEDGNVARNSALELWDISNPYAPQLFNRVQNAATSNLREPHGFGFSSDAQADLLVAQSHEGFHVWDLSDPANPVLRSNFELPGINQSDYGGNWSVFWQAPYVYIAGTGAGLLIAEVSDPDNPTYIKTISNSQMAGISPGQVYAVGNLLFVTQHTSGRMITMDISDPVNPVLIDQLDVGSSYSHFFSGGKMFSSGINGRLMLSDVSPTGQLSFIRESQSAGGRGGYGTYQDDYFIGGFSNKYVKIDIESGQILETASSGIDGRDEDFANPLGNLVMIGNDHNVSSAIAVHQQATDTKGPDVHWVHPADGATNQALTTRIGLSMSDMVEVESLNASSFTVRPVGGPALAGTYSSYMGLINFSPAEPLAPNTTYEIIADNIEDWVGNQGARFVASFKTGDGSNNQPLQNISGLVPANFTVSAFEQGAEVYTDRNYTLTNMPAILEGGRLIKTANDDKNNNTENYISFTVQADSEVFVLYDVRATALPNWMADFNDTGEVVTTTDESHHVYRATFPAGSNVTLGGNLAAGASGARSNYSVVVKANTNVGEAPSCALGLRKPAVVGTSVAISADSVTGTAPITYQWNLGDGTNLHTAQNNLVNHAWQNAGRFAVQLTVSNALGESSCTTSQRAFWPLTTLQPTRSSSIVFDGERVINVNPDNNTVSAIDTNNGTKLWESNVGIHPTSLAVGPNGLIWVVNRDTASISMIDPSDGAVISNITLPYASSPYGIAFTPNGDTALVTLEATGELLRLSPEGTILDKMSIGAKPRGIAIAADNNTVYISRFISPSNQGEVREVLLSDFGESELITLANDPGPDSEFSGRGIPNYLNTLTISPDGRNVKVPSVKANLSRGLYRDGQALTFETRVRTIVSSIETSTGQEQLADRIDLNDRDSATALVYTPIGDIMLVATQGNNLIEVRDAQTSSLIGLMPVEQAPRDLVIAGNQLYVHNYLSRSVSIYDIESLITGETNTGILINHVPVVESEQLTTQVLTGKQIFYNAMDPRMSRDSYISCASCHLDGGNDGQTWDFTQIGEGLRNTPSLKGRAGMGHGNVHWTGNFDEIQDFENDIRTEFGGRGFLTDDQFAQTSNTLGAPKAGLSAELDALAAYVSSLTTVPASPYKNADGSLTSSAQAGRALFNANGCASCHSGLAFTDSASGALHDIGTLTIASGQRLGEMLTGIDTPTLKGVWATAPYLHDGSAPTLKAAIQAHAALSFSEDEYTQLVGFMNQIDENTAPAPPTAPMISITNPDSDISLTQGDPYLITANVIAENTTVSRVEFYNYEFLINTFTNAPYTLQGSTSNIAPGIYSVSAKAYDDQGALIASSEAVEITVIASNNQPPTVSITTPASDTTLIQGDPYLITATANNSDGTITKVELYNYDVLISTLTEAPYSIQGATDDIAPGQYSITATAYDDQGGVFTSDPVVITIEAP